MEIKNKKSFVTFLVIVSLFFVSSLYSEQTYQLKTPVYRIETTGEGFHQVSLKGYSSYGVSGYPDLPARLYRAAVPPHVNPESIDVSYIVTKTEDLGMFDIKEIPPMMTWVDGQIITGEKADVYTKNSFFPEQCVEYTGFSQMRKWRMVVFKFTPFQYNPVSKELRVVTEVKVTIDYQIGDKRSAIDTELHDSVMDSRASALLMNYQESAGWYQPESAQDAPSVTYNYVIITTNAIESSSTKLGDFVTYLGNKGFSPLVITEDEYGGLTGQAPNGTAEKIRKWLQVNYIGYGIQYVLLIGNPDPDDPDDGGDSVGDVPMKMCWPRRGSGTYEEAPTDAFFADLTGNWDLDGDEYYGEWSDFTGVGGVDFANEVYVGRVPVYSGVTNLDSILQKTIDYGNSGDTAWRKSALLPMSFSSSTYDGAPLAEQMKDDFLTAGGYSTWTQYQQGSGACGLDSIYASDEELRGGTVVRDRWAANDYGLVVWWGHGSQTSAVVGCSGCWDGTLMNTSYATALDNNHPSFVYLNSCLNGYPEYSTNLQHAILKNGGIGTVGASRVSWYNTGVGYGTFDGSTTNSGIGYEFASRIVDNQPAGEALCNTKSSMTPEMSTRLMNFYDFNLYGDPAASISGQHSITVTSPNGGEKCNLGTERYITWNCQGVSGDLKIYLYKDGALVGTIDKDIDPAAGSYLWTVGQYEGGTASPGTGYTIKIKEMGVHLSDFSDASFTICSLAVTSPNGGENWKSGSAQTITWTTQGVTNNLKIFLFKDGAMVDIVAKNITPAPSGSYPWIVGQCEGGNVSVGTGYTIKVKEMGVLLSDFSDAPFAIFGITVTAPNGGESWPIGSTRNITWNTQGVTGDLKIYLWKDGALVGTIDKNIDPASGSYAWTVGQYEGGTAPAGTGYTIKVKEMGVTVADFSDNSFELTN